MGSGLQQAMQEHPILTQRIMLGIRLVAGQRSLNDGDIGKTLQEYKETVYSTIAYVSSGYQTSH